MFYNYLKGGRFVDPGEVLDDGTLHFGHQVSHLRIHLSVISDSSPWVRCT